MIRQTKYKSIILTVLLIGFFSLKGKSQPGYPADGFVISFNVDFIKLPENLNSGDLRAKYLDTTLKVIFVDSTKSIEDVTSLISKCSYRVLSVDTNNVAKLIVYIGSSYSLEECYADELIIKKVTTKSLGQNQDVFCWYSGKLIFIYDGEVKQFVCRNIPDGSWLDLQDINFSKSKELILIPPFNKGLSYEKNNITKFRK